MNNDIRKKTVQRMCNKLNRKLRLAIGKYGSTVAALNTARKQMSREVSCRLTRSTRYMILEEREFVMKLKLTFDGYGVTSASSCKRVRNTRRNIRRLYYENQKLKRRVDDIRRRLAAV